MPKYRLGRDAQLKTTGDSLVRFYKKGEVVDISCPPPITAHPLDADAIAAYRAQHGNLRLMPNGLQVTIDGKVRVPAAGGGFSA